MNLEWSGIVWQGAQEQDTCFCLFSNVGVDHNPLGPLFTGIFYDFSMCVLYSMNDVGL